MINSGSLAFATSFVRLDGSTFERDVSVSQALMTEFYTQLQQQPDRAQALRQAMLKTMAEYPDPIDWAAFTLIGETEN
jgi:CHAT domain-containing protein